MSGEAVTVAIRVRPFKQDEIDEKQVVCVTMTDTQVKINDPVDDREKKYTFDYAMWSHDGFDTNEKGVFVPKAGNPKNYCDQQRAWDLLGVRILEKAWSGLNTTLFAYGQTGAGKSYTQFGYGANVGIIPKCADELFKRIDTTIAESPDVSFEVNVRMIEIYCEKLQDLLVQNSSEKGGKDLKIRQIAGQILIPDAVTEPVKTYKQIKGHMDRGDSNRAIGGTKMNATSSRAHTVVTINLKKITKNPTAGKPPLTMESDINLVDLAGSEKSDQAGTTGDRLKEGNAINQSLTSLGNVIEALAENSKPGKKKFIPYRDSKLTQMLQEGLGGNSSTIMVCAIRPGLTYYDETNNTLVWADRAKKIKNKPVINESPQDKIIRELQEENKKLKALMGTGGAVGGGGNDPELEAKLKAAQEEMEANQRQLEEMQKSW
jgi:hypothetical protein